MKSGALLMLVVVMFVMGGCKSTSYKRFEQKLAVVDSDYALMMSLLNRGMTGDQQLVAALHERNRNYGEMVAAEYNLPAEQVEHFNTVAIIGGDEPAPAYTSPFIRQSAYSVAIIGPR